MAAMFGKLDKTLTDFGRIFVKAEMLYVAVIVAILRGIGVWAVGQGQEKGDREQEKYGFMFVGGALGFLLLAVAYVIAVGGSDKLASLVGFSALLRGLRA